MLDEWDGERRTIAFFLTEDPVGVCEVTARSEEYVINVQGSCGEAEANSLVCRHCLVVAEHYTLHGEIPVEIDGSVPQSVIQEAKRDPRLFRELLLTRGRVIVL